ncbi:MAG: TlpA disulfide reductase family protein [Bryobacteraceae bacterium]|jgi:peroxiredoxin
MAFWRQRRMLEAGARAPEFQLQNLDGASQSLSGLLARGPVLLAFFKVECPVCQYTFPFLERIHQGAGGQQGGVQILGVSQDKAGATREFGREFGVSFPILLDDAAGGYHVSNAFGIDTVPSLFLLEPDGSVSLSGAGFSKADLEALGRRAGAAPFRPEEPVPEMRPG